MDLKFLDEGEVDNSFENKGRVRSRVLKIETDMTTEIPTFSYEEIISFHPDVVGNPYGNFGEKEDFVKWLLESKYVKHSDILLKTFLVNFDGDKEITTEYLKSLADVETRKITDLRKSIFYKLIPINRYYREYVNAKIKADFTTYRFNKNGEILFDTKEKTVGRMVRRNMGEALHKWISYPEYSALRNRLRGITERIKEKEAEKLYWREVALDNLFCLLEGKQGREVQHELSEKEYNAVMKLKKPQYFVTKCSYCEGVIKFPLTPNIENDRFEKLAHSLYLTSLNEFDVVLCKKCKEDVWNENEVVETFKAIKRDKVYKLSVEKFCQTFRKDKKVLDSVQVGEWLADLFRKKGVKRKVFVDEVGIVVC